MRTWKWLPGIVMLCCGLVLGSLWAAGSLRATQDQPPANGKPDPDLEAIKATADKYSEAFNAQNASAMAQLFTEEAEFVDGGDNVVHGKKAIEAAFTQYFQTHPKSKLVIDMDVVRRLGSNTLLEEGTYYFADATDPAGPEDRSEYIILHVKQADGWRVASIRCKRNTDNARDEHLRQLGWLVGSWVDEGADEVIRSTWNWSDDGNYLLGEFTVESKGQLLMKGSQRIGYDGNRKQIRSWVFDSAGGFVEGYWHKNPSGQWVSKSTGVNADGETTSQTTIYEPHTKDRFLLTLRDRVDGETTLPDVTVTIMRTPAPPKQ